MTSVDDQLKFFSVAVNNGSGCIFQPHTKNYTYVLTVKHNLIKTKDQYTAKIRRFNLEESDELSIKNIYVHPDEYIDLALITVEYIGDNDYHLMYSDCERDEIVDLYGYPEISRKSAIKTQGFRCRCDGEHQKDISYRIISENPLFTFNRSSVQNVTGFSGCGIFSTEDQNILLKGILPELHNSDGAHNTLHAYKVECFNAIIKENNLDELVPSFLLNFNHVRHMAFFSIEPHISSLIEQSIDKVINSNISPNQIADHFKGKLYIPYTAKYRNKLINKDLWKGWLELLTVLNIIDESTEENRDNNTLLKEYLKNIKLIFSMDEAALSVIIKEMIVDPELNKYLINDACIVINSTIDPQKRIYTKQKIKRILPDITRASRYDRNIFIDEANNSFSFSCLHLSHFLEKIGRADINEQDSNEEISLDMSRIKLIINKIIAELND